MKLTPEDLEKVQTKKVANVLRKLHAGKTLTSREDALLTAAVPEDRSTRITSADEPGRFR